MLASALLTLLAAQSGVAPAPPSRAGMTCLLAGPSRTLVAMNLVPYPEGYRLTRVEGQAWPFSSEAVLLRDSGNSDFSAQDAGAGLFARFAIFWGERGGANLEVIRGTDRRAGLPLLVGSCAEAGSPAALEYQRLAHDTRYAPRTDGRRLNAASLAVSRDCQVVSAAGWVSRFSMTPSGDTAITVRPIDQRIFHATTVSYARRGMPMFPIPGWALRGFQLVTDAQIPRSLTNLWVYASPDRRQSSVRFGFYGYDPEGPITREDLAGVCTSYADASASR